MKKNFIKVLPDSRINFCIFLVESMNKLLALFLNFIIINKTNILFDVINCENTINPLIEVVDHFIELTQLI